MRSAHHLAAALALSCLAAAQSTPTHSLEHFDEMFATWVDRGKLAGVVAIVARRDEILYENAIGMRDLDTEEPVEMDTIFRIYSMTKPVTAVAALILCDDGVLGLDEKVSKYLPKFAHLEVAIEKRDPTTKKRTMTRVPMEREITIRDLLRHTSGIPYGLFGNSLVDRMIKAVDPLDPDLTLDKLCDHLADIPLKHQPGVTVEYGLSIDVLGHVVELASGQALDEFMEQRIFEPLGMHDTGFHVGPDHLDRLSPLYRQARGDLEKMSPFGLQPDPTQRPTLFSGGAGLYSTAGDFIRFCRMLLHSGKLDGVRILRSETVDEMCRNQLDDEELSLTGPAAVLARSGFGLGGAVVSEEAGRKGSKSAGTYSWGGAAGTFFWVDRTSDLTGVFMVQSWFDGVHFGIFQNEVYDALGK